MPDTRIKLKDIFKESNMLLLTKSMFFQNTARIESSSYMPSIRRGKSRFFGYVYKFEWREHYVPYVFENGLTPTECDIESGAPPGDKRIRGKTYGTRLTDLSTLSMGEGIDTHICFYLPPFNQPPSSLAFLIDIRELGGIVLRKLPVRYYNGAELFNVIINYPVSKSRIVGVIRTLLESSGQLIPQQLELYVNPNYTGGMEGARAVAAYFNGESEWLVVDY
ncbi:hypothetical protein NX722_00740 [Endozoicomonas gorgoniicola]|uniref:Uncharacterized protein n=1 Tax=Endozoicomonas gorgoniicola TaxID=1234144 RepID=A0ABT3MPD2_9GAMM|nr:hypothetical protein [Endozoicomonas gorgoniicola]MCW7551206.1 hypothetical protein [Endozoicomonas gorgoniicola]